MTSWSMDTRSSRNYFFALLICLVLAIQPGFASGPDTWIPARWQGGPLELERRAHDKTLPTDPALRETLSQWYDPATLDLLQGTPINCLLVTWSVGGDPEIEQQHQKLVKAYAQRARMRGFAVLGLIHPGSVPSSFVEPAVDAGLDGLVLEGEFPGGEHVVSELQQSLRNKRSAAVVVPLTTWEKLTPSLGTPVWATNDAVAPGLRESGEGVEATPSSEPWIDSNIWQVRSIRSWGRSRPVWLGEQIGPSAAPDDYLRAIADAAIGGGRWVLALSDQMRHSLRQRQPEAMATWGRIAAYLKFQQEHADWNEYPPFAVYGFIQDSFGKDRTMSGENLNLAYRQRIPLRVIERAQLSSATLEGLQAVQGIDLIQPTELERKILLAFAEKGGLVVVGPSWTQVKTPKDRDFTVLPTGKGRVVVYRDEWPEAGNLAKALIDLLGRDNLGVRLFRVTSVLSHISSGKDGDRTRVQLLNYASYPADSVLVRVTGAFRTAHFYTPESAPVELTLEKSEGRIEVNIPTLSIYGELLLEK
jgi:hypothetical protein